MIQISGNGAIVHDQAVVGAAPARRATPNYVPFSMTLYSVCSILLVHAAISSQAIKQSIV